MSKKYAPIVIKNLTTCPISNRESKVGISDFARRWTKGGDFAEFLDTLPHILAAEDLKRVITAVADAFANNRRIIFGMGAHVIKVGLNPLVIDLMHRGVFSAVAMNGAGIIHDFELAIAGNTSEDVSATLGSGQFGMTEETGRYLSEAVHLANTESLGLGAAVGRMINRNNMPHRDMSILAAADAMGIPVTVHVAMGTDILHMHPDFDPGAAGAASHLDFRLFAALVAELSQGVYINAGSAVILPEIFLKALTLVRNLGHEISGITTVNMDFIKHYRPLTNVVNRPTEGGGTGINLVGHHEIMLPLIAAGIIEKIDKPGQTGV